MLELGLEHCLSRDGELNIIAAILEQPVIERILTHFVLQESQPPPRSRALQSAPMHTA